MDKIWKTSRRAFNFDKKCLVMGILNITPDSFSDGGRFSTLDNALRHVEEMIAQGVDIIDVGGESTRPKAQLVDEKDEIERTAPVIAEITKRFDVAVSIDTWKSGVARAAVDSGAEIINDISGLRFDENIGKVAAQTGAGIVAMHIRGTRETMHLTDENLDILTELSRGFNESISIARSCGVEAEKIALDIGIGFGKTLEQNLQIIANLARIIAEFSDFPILVGASRKSFIGKITGEEDPLNRLPGSLSAAAIAIFSGAKILRVHDVAETVQAAKIALALRSTINE